MRIIVYLVFALTGFIFGSVITAAISLSFTNHQCLTQKEITK